MAVNDVTAKRSWVEALSLSLDARWPWAKLMSLALMSSWILIAFMGLPIQDTSLASGIDVTSPLVGISMTAGAALGSFALALWRDRFDGLFLQSPFVAVVSVVLGALGLLIYAGAPSLFSTALLLYGVLFACGVCLAIIMVRLGNLYSMLNGANAFFPVAASGCLANLLFFMFLGVATCLKCLLVAVLPVLAVAMSNLGLSRRVNQYMEKRELVDSADLPGKFFPKMVLAIFVFSFAVGTFRGLIPLLEQAGFVYGQMSTTVFLSFVALGGIGVFAAVMMAFKDFDVSKTYYPVIVACCLTIVLMPLAGQRFASAIFIVNGAAYNVFIMVIWCLLTEISGRTTLSPFLVFGCGRGASACALTLGYVIAPLAMDGGGDDYSGSSLALHFILIITTVVMVLFVFKEQTVSDAVALARSRGSVTDEERAHVRSTHTEDPWKSACFVLSQDCSLTSREQDVLVLLTRGRTVSVIGEELGIAYNTAKGYTKNVYRKCNVHTRQELIDLVEKKRDNAARL